MGSMQTRLVLASCALGAALSVVLVPRTATAQGSEASGVGVGVQGMLTSAAEIPTGLDTFVDIPALAGPAVTYQTPKFHIDGILSYGDNDAVTVLGVGGRFYYELHSTQASDLSVGGGLGFMSVDFGPDSDTAVLLEAGGKLRAFLAPSVAVNASLGLGYIAGLADRDYILFGGQLVGGIGISYFFF
jgi:hypothetical protein